MQKSFIDRVFPKPKRSILPIYDESPTYRDDETHSSRVTIRPENDVSSSRLSATSSGSKHSLKATPLSASVIHHDDPFLAVDRAARNLQKTIQSLLDLQSQSLSGRTQDSSEIGIGLQAAATPNQSMTGYSDFGPSVVGAVPIRQPRKKNLSLRGTRRNLTKSMREFAALKEEELRVIQGERAHRKTALKRISDLETRREAVEHEITVFREQSNNNEAQTFRSEADKVEKEIHELEGRLMELQARHRHLIRRAEQVENTTASELSSYEGTLKLVDRETKAFLRRPPVPQALSSRSSALSETDTNMYVLTADRRNLAMAKDQWTTELDTLTTQEQNVQRDREALLEGAEIWRETSARIEVFEQDLRSQMKSAIDSSTETNLARSNSTTNLLASLDNTALFLHQQLEQAESQNWNLLICAIGAELQAFREARILLAPDEPAYPFHSKTLTQTTSHESNSENDDIPHADLLSNGEHLAQGIATAMGGPLINTATSHADDGFEGSNESLKATLRNLSPTGAGAGAAQKITTHNVHIDAKTASSRTQRSTTTYSESDDDDPGPEFLLSH